MEHKEKQPLLIAGAPLSSYYRLISSVIRSIYYPGCTLQGNIDSLSTNKPTLILCSHRNSAFDGYLILKAFPLAQALASIQLLNSAVMRLFFTGIPVVRKKDKMRFNITANSFDSPVDAGVAHISAGGSLMLFPEGSSEWGYKPLPYQRGAARIIRTLISLKVDFNVIPVGLFYSEPDKFASKAEIFIGKPIEIISQQEQSEREWEKNIHTQISDALDAVSVNCLNEQIFNDATHHAAYENHQGNSYATAFLDYQQTPENFPAIKSEPIKKNHAVRWLGFCLMFILLPILLAALFTSRYADARNTISFFKILGGSLAGLIWLPIIAISLFIWPKFILISLASALIGYLFIIKTH
ncbi:1-acyl-sn-glycerol-3-phosphate acyltransferase [Providencia burhodogranariea]|uniref:Phospholipid/glycerol acyltransferase n=1 Tax=Providencia burhodogranariea DSM 19968 TaxID=1141662 RepID=K8WBA4_9GAMM|nr:1-acyl-sn-glycerol-3-phosphate acyltransferase [Providencia burhodogranariea]EKT57201.1 phospholipid/glycerol acyltransferase [Providencia burhodogranariea DSM 19968]